MVERVHKVGRVVLFLLAAVTFPLHQAAASAPPSCGGLNEDCCGTLPQCGTGLSCNSGICLPCGGANEPCCDGQVCDVDLTCEPCQIGVNCETRGGGATGVSDVCVPCGGENEACCQGIGCDNNNCVGGICQPCGGDGESCCPGSDCETGFVCLPAQTCETTGEGTGGGAGFDCETLDAGSGAIAQLGTCRPCGGEDQLCCEEFSCNEGFTCLGASGESDGTGGGAGPIPLPMCAECGDLGEICCDDSTCDGANLLCNQAVCEACGAIGQQCCANDTCPNAIAACIEGTCEAIPAAPLMAPGVVIALLLTLTGLGALRLKRS